MSARPWVDRCRSFFSYMRSCAWEGHFRLRGSMFDIIGMPAPWQARDADNDNRRP